MTPMADVPMIVRAEPRYQQETVTLFSGEERQSPLWNLDGVPWHKVPPPRKRGHEHVAQTVGLVGLFEEVWRCPCSAIGGPGYRGWVNLEERFAPVRDHVKFERLFTRILGGVVIA
jgi:hypothetical protein